MSVPARDLETQARWPTVRQSVLLFAGGLGLALVLHLPTLGANEPDLPLKDRPHLRRPVAAVPIGPDRIAIANERSGTLSIADLRQAKAAQEIAVGERLSAVAMHPQQRWLFLTDRQRHELIVGELTGTKFEVSERLAVGQYPVDVVVSPGGEYVAVASLWCRKVTLFRCTQSAHALQLRRVGEILLPFNPRLQAFTAEVANGSLVVADAFAGKLAVIDVGTRELRATHQVNGQQIRRLTLNGDGTLEVIHHADPMRLPQGDEVAGRGRAVGLEKSQLTPEILASFTPNRLDSRPVEGQTPYVRDAIYGAQRGRTVGGAEALSYEGQFIMLGPVGMLTPAERGEELFFDTQLSAGKWMSCQTCHVDGHTSGLRADTQADGTSGSPKRIPTLLGTRLSDPWAWNAHFRNLDEQIRSSLATTMHVKDVTVQRVGDLAAYLHTLPPAPPLQPATGDPADEAQLARGKVLFGELGCAKCHVPPLTYTSPDTYDVGLADEAGMTKFNPPSLRGVSQGYAFFHDGRAKTLEEVLTVHGHQLDQQLEVAELADLLRFLRSL